MLSGDCADIALRRFSSWHFEDGISKMQVCGPILDFWTGAKFGHSFTPPPLRLNSLSPVGRGVNKNAMIKTAEHDNKDLWVFAYGSLMWRPGFSYLERVPARLIGLHRALCVFSFVHRGTPERPGLVLGLDRGGMCRGIAYRVAAAARAETLHYLRAREQVTTVYVESMRQIDLEERARRRVRAVCYIVDRSHVQYAGRLTLMESLHHVRQGHGQSGANRDYVLETVRALEALGYRESDLHLLAERLASQGSVVRDQKSAINDQERDPSRPNSVIPDA